MYSQINDVTYIFCVPSATAVHHPGRHDLEVRSRPSYNPLKKTKQQQLDKHLKRT